MLLSFGPDGEHRAGGIRDQPSRRQRGRTQPPSASFARRVNRIEFAWRAVPNRMHAYCKRTDVRSNACPAGGIVDEDHQIMNPPRLRNRSERWALDSINWYQRLVEGRPSPCRFFPSCSSYAAEAFQVHGTRRAMWLTIRRLLRCRPFGPSGFDPVPEPADDRQRVARRPHSCALSVPADSTALQ